MKRYVIMFYDYPFPKVRVVSGEHWWHSRQEPLQRTAGPSISESLRVMGISEEQFQRMDLKALQRLYRAKAKKCHPDRGGCKEEFIALKKAYERLRELKR
ncbi:MAG: J domain-containing protein [Nitrospirae bacterium]|nr:MAG: J domain-containing protein [Nitrospirota bacterium]